MRLMPHPITSLPHEKNAENLANNHYGISGIPLAQTALLRHSTHRTRAILYQPVNSMLGNCHNRNHMKRDSTMSSSFKGTLTASAIGIMLASTLATPAKAAVIEHDFTVTGPGGGMCRMLEIEFYTPGSSQEPRHENLVACGNHTTTAHFLSNHTHVRTTERNIWSGPAVDNDR